MHCLFVRRYSTFDAVFFLVLTRLENKRTVFWKKKEKKLIATKSELVQVKEYLEIYNRVKYFLSYFFNATLSRQTLWRFSGSIIPMSQLRKFENRSVKPVHTTLGDDTHRRSPGHPQLKSPQG